MADIIHERSKAAESSILADFARSIAYSAVVQPLNGVVQLGAKLCGKDVEQWSCLRPENPDSWAAKVGGAIGMAVDFWAINKLTGGEAALSQMPSLTKSVSRAATVGALYDGLAVPIADPHGSLASFAAQRGQNAIVGGLTFASLDGTSRLLPALPGLNKLARNNTIFTRGLFGALSGLPAGIVNAETHSLVFQHQFTTNVGSSIRDFSVIGGVLGVLPHTERPDAKESRRAQESNAVQHEETPTAKQATASEATLGPEHVSWTKNPQVIARLLQAGDAKTAAQLASLVSSRPDWQPTIEQEVIRGAAPQLLRSWDRLKALTGLAKHIQLDSPLMQKIFDSEATDRFAMQKMAAFINADPATRLPLLEREAAKGKRELLGADRLSGLAKLEEYFQSDNKTLKHILQMEKADGLDLKQLAEFIDLDPKNFAPFIAGRIQAGETDSELGEYVAYSHPFGSLAQAFYDDIPALLRIRQLKKELDLEHLMKFVDIDTSQGQGMASTWVTAEGRRSLVSRELRRGATADQLNSYYRMRGLEQLEREFPPGSDMHNRLLRMEARDGLSLWNLGKYVGDWTEARATAVKQEIENGAPVKQIEDQVKLAAFPTDVAVKLSKQAGRGTVQTDELVSALLDLQTGPYMQQLVRVHVEKGNVLTTKDLERFGNEARLLFESKAPLATNVESWTPQSRLRLPTETDRTVAHMASSVRQAAQGIMDSLPPNKSMVLLGRDMGPLLAILRASGRDVRYFLWSRSQNGDASTAAQWQKEVPPQAVVIDAGLSGSIFDNIRKTDANIEPYLMQSAGRYPQFPVNMDVAANDVELFPKLTGRSLGFKPDGTAIAPDTSLDAQDFHDANHRQEAVQYNSQLLRDLGLSDWWVWRYQTFTGIAPSERIGITDGQKLAQEYSRIKDLRNSSQAH